MFCEKCGKEMNGERCENCGHVIEPAVNVEPVNVEDNYEAKAKKYWYCFLFPILFFIPMVKEKGNENAMAVANNVLWLMILNVGIGIASPFFSGVLLTLLNLLSVAISVFAIVAAIKACIGKGIKVPGLGDVKIIK